MLQASKPHSSRFRSWPCFGRGLRPRGPNGTPPQSECPMPLRAAMMPMSRIPRTAAPHATHFLAALSQLGVGRAAYARTLYVLCTPCVAPRWTRLAQFARHLAESEHFRFPPSSILSAPHDERG